MTDSEFISSKGFSVERSVNVVGICEREYYVKEIRMCNSNCIGCEYVLCIVLEMDRGSYETTFYLHKPPMRDDERFPEVSGMMRTIPKTTLFLMHTERSSLEDAIFDCVNIIENVMVAMDFRQISGMDFIDISNSERNGIMEDANCECRRLIDELGACAKG